MHANQSDNNAIDQLIERFFRAFDNHEGHSPGLADLNNLFAPGAVVTRTGGDEPASTGLEEFIAPRRALLSSGELTEFRESQLWHQTTVVGAIAHRLAAYEKSWWQDGAKHHGRGIKSFQLARTTRGWRILALAWDDERDGVVVPATPPGTSRP